MSTLICVLVAGLALIAATPRTAHAQLDQLLKNLPSLGAPSRLGDVRIGDGLREALKVGTEKAVGITGKTDGYFMNQAIKILMPPKLHGVETGLRAVGYGPQVDQFVLSMNRAAERAAPAAKSIFWDAIGAMTIDDARKILDGPNNAATEYFREKTTPQLTAAFRPVVERTMNEVGVTRQYSSLLGMAEGVPFLRTESLDIHGYVVGKALDGLFHVVGEQEKQIRQNPAARTTELLKEVFGSRAR